MSKMISSFAAKMLQIKMFSKFFARLCLGVLVVQLAVIIIYNSWFNAVWEATKHMFFGGVGISWDMLTHLKFAPAAKIFKNSWDGFWELQSLVVTRSLVVWVLLPITLIYMAVFDEDEDEGKEFIQGRRFIPHQELNFLAHGFSKFVPFQRLRFKKCLPLGNVYLPIVDEPKQTFVIGKPGVGKTNLFNYIIQKIRTRAQRVVIHDYKGDYVEMFYDSTRGDILFNPLDVRSVGWCLFNDCKSIMDVEAFAHGLIPDPIPGSDPFWNNSARDIFVGILRYCYVSGKTSNKDIWQTVTLPNVQLYEILQTTKGGELGAKHLEDPDGKTAMNIMSNLMQYVKVFEYMSTMSGDFSITDWVTNENQVGSIFITNYANLQNILKPMISLFIQTVGRVLLSQCDDRDNRLFFILDEFGQLPNLATIQNLMTTSRSKGGSIFIGVQDIGQIDKVYKKESRTTILNSASNRIIFNCKDHDTAKFFSVDIGETEYYENTLTKSLNMGDGDRVNTSKQRRKEYLVTAEDIQSLPDLVGFVSIGHHNVTLSKWKYLKLKPKTTAFIQRPDLNLTGVVDVSLFINQDSESMFQKEPSIQIETSEMKADDNVMESMNSIIVEIATIKEGTASVNSNKVIL